MDGDNPAPMEVFVNGHVPPEQAIIAADDAGMNLCGHLTVEHQTVNLPRWYKPAGEEEWSQ